MTTLLTPQSDRLRRVRTAIATALLPFLTACGGDGRSSPAAAVTGSIDFTSCQVPAGSAACAGSVRWQRANATAPRLSVAGQILAQQASGSVDITLPGDFVDIVLSNATAVLDSVTIRGVCETASAWDGAACTNYAVRLDERASTPFVKQGVPVELEVVIFKPEGPDADNYLSQLP